MKQSYRQFLLQTLQLDTLNIAATLREQKQQIDNERQQVQAQVYRFVLPASVVVLLLWIVLTWPTASGFVVSLAGVSILVAACAAVIWLPVVQRQVHRFIPGVVVCEKRIAQAQDQIDQARQKAVLYQQHLEPASAPGLLAVFADVLTHPACPSCFSHEQRQRFVDLSIQGRASSIDIIDYGKLLLELKNVHLANYCGSQSLVEQVPAKNKVEVALAYAQLLGQTTCSATARDIQFVALVGLNAVSMCKQHSLPTQWQAMEHKRWEMAGRVLRLAFEQKTLALAKALSEFDQLQRRRGFSLTA